MLGAITRVGLFYESNDRVCSANMRTVVDAIQTGSSESGFAGQDVDSVAAEFSLYALAVEENGLSRARAKRCSQNSGAQFATAMYIFKIIEQT